METVEWYFFKWAYPCMYVLHQNGVISDDKLKEMDGLYARGLAPEKNEIEKIFFAAIRRIDKIAEERNLDRWDFDVHKEYWQGGGHNRVIDNREGNYKYFDETFCYECKVKEGQVIAKESKTVGTILEVRLENETRKFVQGKFLDANIGDIVLTHLAYAVQKA